MKAEINPALLTRRLSNLSPIERTVLSSLTLTTHPVTGMAARGFGSVMKLSPEGLSQGSQVNWTTLSPRDRVPSSVLSRLATSTPVHLVQPDMPHLFAIM
jgi:hypothetical protein